MFNKKIVNECVLFTFQYLVAYNDVYIYVLKSLRHECQAWVLPAAMMAKAHGTLCSPMLLKAQHSSVP